MQYSRIAFLLLTLLFFSCVQEKEFKQLISQGSPAELVNPLMGTDSEFNLSNGNTYPAVAIPWGMNFWTPMTSPMGDGWTYKYDEHKIRGFKQTHQPSPWINDYAAFSLMPVTGKLRYRENERSSWFSHKAEEAHPYHYKVYLADYDVTAEVSPTERAAYFRFSFPESDSSYIVLDGFDKGSMVRIIPEERKIIGYCRNHHGGVPDNFHNYFVATFDKDFETTYTWSKDWVLKEGSTESESLHSGAIVRFSTKRGEKVHVRVASSFISHEQAALNLEQEIGDKSFDEVRSEAYEAWNRELGRIEIEDPNMDNIRSFYSCLYRLLLFPRKFYEINKEGKVVHYSPYDGGVYPGYMFTDNGFWDTFRAVFPFFNLMYPEMNSLIMKGLANTYREGGWLPEWASPGYRNSMIGSNSSSIIADAYIKGIKDMDINLLLEAMIKNATIDEGRPISAVGREGVQYYNELGYVPYDVGIHENAARSLEYAYADFCIAQVAKDLGQEDIAEKYFAKALNYQKLFDTESGWMRGKMKNGDFQSPFNPLKWGDAFTEGNSLHYSWSVFQDVSGLIKLMGGDSAFVAKLDTVFNMPPDFDDSYYGFTIHEIHEMQIINMGNYAHGNQPIQHMTYLYNYARQPWKTQMRVREIMDKLYSATPDGYCGDEDNGQTSAWYVFSALGFYPVCPATTQYVIGSPLFQKVTLSLSNGKSFAIVANNNSHSNIFIDNASYNGQTYTRNWIDHQDILSGGELKFEMMGEPGKTWGSDSLAIPYSLSNDGS